MMIISLLLMVTIAIIYFLLIHPFTQERSFNKNLIVNETKIDVINLYKQIITEPKSVVEVHYPGSYVNGRLSIKFINNEIESYFIIHQYNFSPDILELIQNKKMIVKLKLTGKEYNELFNLFKIKWKEQQMSEASEILKTVKHLKESIEK